MTANTSWNAAIAALGICFGALLVFIVASAFGWHRAFTGPAAGVSAVAAVGCGVWLGLTASRLGPLEPEPGEDEEPQP